MALMAKNLPNLGDHEKRPKSASQNKMTVQAKLGSSDLCATVDFDSDDIPEKGSREMFDAIFKNSKRFGKLSNIDRDQIDKSVSQFWESPGSKYSSTKKNPRKRKVSSLLSSPPSLKASESPHKSPLSKSNEPSASDLNESQDFEYDEMTDQVKQHLLTAGFAKANNLTTGASKLHNIDDIVTLNDSDDEDTTTKPKGPRRLTVEHVLLSSDSEDEEIFIGKTIMLYAMVQGKKHSIKILDSLTIANLREKIGEKAELKPGYLRMFLGVTLLDDNDTVKDCGITNLTEVDVFYKPRTAKEMYDDGCKSVLRFKLQTSDRRGRGDNYVYVEINSKMQCALDEYAKITDVDPKKIKLMFDGDRIDLESKPGECDLDGEECIDVFITE